jgi:hypothetical protein
MQDKRGLLIVFLGLLMGGAFWGGYLLSQSLPISNSAAVLGARVERRSEVEVFRVIQDESVASIILPRFSVQTNESGENFVLVLDENSRVQKKLVQAQVWRGQYVKIFAGLDDQDLVVLNNQIAVGRTVDYKVANPEAGKSGLLN